MDGHNWFGEDLMQEEWENSDDIGLKKIDLGEEEKLAFDTQSYVSVEIDKPDEKKISKIVLTWAIIFSLVTIPIFYHNIRNYINDYCTTSTRNPLRVKTTKLSYKNLYDKSEITGLISAESSVDIVARVDGYLEKTYFKEGDFVRKGQLLFTIEPNEYKISVRAAEAEVAQAMALYTNSIQELERAKELVKENFISRSDYDSIVAAANSQKASLDAANQSLARARLNLSYTNIYAPMAGKAGKINMSDGNYVGLQSGPLVTIAKMDPICVDFSMKSSDVLKMKHGNNNLDINTAKVELLLSDDTKYDKIGKIIFSDNVVSSQVASLSLRAVFQNHDNILIPGDYVRVIITSKEPHNKLLVPQAITHGDALNGYYLWTVKDGETHKNRITVSGSEGSDWIVESGVTAEDDVIKSSNEPIDMERIPVLIKTSKKQDSATQ